MDFAVAAIRCFDTIKVHHDKRWLRQQRLLCISTHEILNCPWPAPGTKAMKLYELFSTPIHQSGSDNQEEAINNNIPNLNGDVVAIPPAAIPVVAESSSTDGIRKQQKSLQNKLVVTEEMILLEERYKKACEIVLTPETTNNSSSSRNTSKSNLTSLMIASSSSSSSISISFEDIKKILNPTKVNTIAEVNSTALKGDDHLCINFKNDHPYFYNTPVAIEIAKLVRTRYIAWTSAKLVQGNFVSPSLSSSTTPSPSTSSLQQQQLATMELPQLNPDQLDQQSPTTNDESTTNGKNNKNDDDGSTSSKDENYNNEKNNNTTVKAFPTQMNSSSAVGYNRISELFQAGVIELPTTFDVVDHLQSQIMLLTKALDWIGEPASVFAGIANSLHKLSDDTASWKTFEHTMASGAELQAIKQKAIDAATSPNSRSRAESQIVSGNPSKAKEFRDRFDQIRDLLVNNYLVSGVKEVVQPEKSLSEKLAFWRSPRRIPQFDESDEAELVAEMALQNLLYRNPATLKNLWADIQVAYREEMELFAFNCRMLSAPVVPFAYFGISPDFENVRFDLVRYHLLTLMGCKTPSMMLNSIVAAIKSVIVCIKAKHVLSKRWDRAFSTNTNKTSESVPIVASTASSPADESPVAQSPTTAVADTSNSNNDTTAKGDSTSSLLASGAGGGGGGFWSRDELDQIATEAKKHSSYNTDDILPVFIYIVVYCDLPQLLLYCRFLETLSFEGEASERSFYVTVFYSAIQWILDWKKPIGSGGGKKSRGNSKISNHNNNNSSSLSAPNSSPALASTVSSANGKSSSLMRKKERRVVKKKNVAKKVTVKKKKANIDQEGASNNVNDESLLYYDEEEEITVEEEFEELAEEEEEEEVVEFDNLEEDFCDDEIWEQAAALAVAGIRGENHNTNNASRSNNNSTPTLQSMTQDNNANAAVAGRTQRTMSHSPFSSNGFSLGKK